MAVTLDIQIYGEILPEGYIWDDEGTSLYRVRKQVEAAGSFDRIRLNIFSPGGYCLEGWAIVDYLLSLGKPIDTLAYGQCASFGTVFHTMGEVREVSPHCEYMIHRPWDFFMGNDIQIDELNASLKKETAKLFEHYAKPTGMTVDELATLINKEDLKLSPIETVTHGFSTAIYQPGASASTAINSHPISKPTYLMSLKDRTLNPNAPNDFTKPTNKMAENKNALLNAAKAVIAFIGGTSPKALDVPLKDGRKIVTNSTGEVPVIGDTAEIDGAAAPDGDYITDKDVTITVVGGIITAVVEPATAAGDDTSIDPSAAGESATVAALKKENESLKASQKETSDKLAALEQRIAPVLAAIVSQDPQTQANIQPSTTRTAAPSTERDDMLKKHLEKFAPKKTA